MMQQVHPNNYDNLRFEERLQLLIDVEHLKRGQLKQKRLLMAAKQKLHAIRQGD